MVKSKVMKMTIEVKKSIVTGDKLMTMKVEQS